MAYEEMKRWGFERKRKNFAKTGRTMTPEDDKLASVIDHSQALRLLTESTV